jgi:hypothetical protein
VLALRARRDRRLPHARFDFAHRVEVVRRDHRQPLDARHGTRWHIADDDVFAVGPWRERLKGARRIMHLVPGAARRTAVAFDAAQREIRTVLRALELHARNRLSPDTAARVFDETLAPGTKPLQLYATDTLVRAIHGASYTRLYNVDLLTMVREFATDFQPAQQAGGADEQGGTGLYCGEQDMFCFLIDPLGWTEIRGEAFAPGFFLWNSEVGRRSVGVQTFWFQAVCQNHIVWDAVEVVDYSRKHTANVHECLSDIRNVIERLVAKRDERRDGFTKTIVKAMETRLGDSADEVTKALTERGITRKLAKDALEIARQHGAFTIFTVVDALTRLAGKMQNAGDRSEADAKASALLALA